MSAFDMPQQESNNNGTPEAPHGVPATHEQRGSGERPKSEDASFQIEPNDTIWARVGEELAVRGQEQLDATLATLEKNRINARLGTGRSGQKEWVADIYQPGIYLLPAKVDVPNLAKAYIEAHSNVSNKNGSSARAEAVVPPQQLKEGKPTAPSEINDKENVVQQLAMQHKANANTFNRERDEQGLLGISLDWAKGLLGWESSSDQVHRKLKLEQQQIDDLRSLAKQPAVDNSKDVAAFNAKFLELTGTKFDPAKIQEARLSSTSSINQYSESQKSGVDAISSAGAVIAAIVLRKYGVNKVLNSTSSAPLLVAGTMASDAALTSVVKLGLKSTDKRYLDAKYDLMSGAALGALMVPTEVIGTATSVLLARSSGLPMTGNVITGRLLTEGQGIGLRAAGATSKWGLPGFLYGASAPFAIEGVRSQYHGTTYDQATALEAAKVGGPLGFLGGWGAGYLASRAGASFASRSTGLIGKAEVSEAASVSNASGPLRLAEVVESAPVVNSPHTIASPGSALPKGGGSGHELLSPPAPTEIPPTLQPWRPGNTVPVDQHRWRNYSNDAPNTRGGASGDRGDTGFMRPASEVGTSGEHAVPVAVSKSKAPSFEKTVPVNRMTREQLEKLVARLTEQRALKEEIGRPFLAKDRARLENAQRYLRQKEGQGQSEQTPDHPPKEAAAKEAAAKEAAAKEAGQPLSTIERRMTQLRDEIAELQRKKAEQGGRLDFGDNRQLTQATKRLNRLANSERETGAADITHDVRRASSDLTRAARMQFSNGSKGHPGHKAPKHRGGKSG